MLVKSRPKYITLGILGAMMALLIVGLMYSQKPVQADHGLGHEVDTGAVVVPLGAPPVFECKWELPDMRPGYSVVATVPDPTIQYDILAVNAVLQHQHDDDMALRPSVTPACTGPPQTLPGMPQDVMNMIQVMPLPHANPNAQILERDIQLWAAVDHPSGISEIGDVYWKIFHPDGSFKVQVHGTKIGDKDNAKPSPGVLDGGASQGGFDHDNDAFFGTGGMNAADRRLTECAMLGQHDTEGSMFEAAYHTGQISAAAIDDEPRGMVYKCKQNEKAIYYAKFDVIKDQPCGKYKIEAHATSNGVEAEFLVNYIDVLCFWYLNTDFSDLSWGSIVPGSTQTISGDLDWDDGTTATPSDTTPAPTVHNGGNHPMGIRIHFSTMWQDNVSGPKKIEWFDACYGKSTGFGTLECLGQSDTGMANFPEIPSDSIKASQWIGFGPKPAIEPLPTHSWHGDWDQVLCANDVAKLDLSIHPYEFLTPAGSYTGSFDLVAHTIHDIDHNACGGDQEHNHNSHDHGFGQ